MSPTMAQPAAARDSTAWSKVALAMLTLCDILERVRGDDRPDLLMARPAAGKPFEEVSAADWLRGIELCARGLTGLGVSAGDRVGLICSNRPEWHVIDFACHRLGAILVPLFTTLVSEQVGYCFGDAGCRLAFVEGQEQLDKVIHGCAGNEILTTIVAIGAVEADAAGSGIAIVDLVDLLQRSAGEANLPGPADPDAVVTIIYTSGTTGPPKGVMLTHANFVANIEGIQEAEPVLPDDIGMSLLPLCHVYERLLDYTYLVAGARIAYSTPESVAADFKAVRPTIMIGVPRLYQKLRAAVEARFEEGGGRAKAIYRQALAVGTRRARARLLGEPEGMRNKLLHPLLDFLVLSKIREVAGGRMRVLSAGGAAIDTALAWWFLAVGWDLVQGYGLSETLIISTNRRLDNRVGTVGRALFNVGLKVDENGEILTRGEHVMAGYWQRPDATAATILDGWLYTGDVGRIDSDGYLTITDRKKSILVTSTGKKVAPQPLESALIASAWIEQIIAVGDDRRFIAALVVPDWARVERWAERQGASADRSELVSSEALRVLLEQEIEAHQQEFSKYERVRAFRLLTEPFTLANGRLTPTLKPIRHRIVQDYGELIEEIYAE